MSRPDALVLEELDSLIRDTERILDRDYLLNDERLQHKLQNILFQIQDLEEEVRTRLNAER